jgi:hypothetical protein
MLLYQWGTDSRFLVHHVLQLKKCLTASPADTAKDVWERMQASGQPITAFIFHINVTVTRNWPVDRPRLLDCLDRNGIVTLNGNLTDISKRHIENVVAALSFPGVTLRGHVDPDLIVIVKTNSNYGGKSEIRLGKELYRPDGPEGSGNPSGYWLTRFRDVPERILADRNLVVQRYISNDENVIYRAYVLLDQVVISRAVNPSPIKKMHRGLKRENYFLKRSNPSSGLIGQIRDQVCAMAVAVGMDFGAMDVVVSNDGIPYVIDVNSTPGWGDESQPDIIEHLSAGAGKSGPL